MRRRFLVTAVAAALATLLGPPVASAQEEFERYVALGDSFASGPFIPVQRIDPVGCGRSTNNYPSVLARKLRPAQFVDVSCGGAQTEDMTAAQSVPLGSNPPQFDVLTEDTDLVTVSISGNDAGFSDIVTACIRLSFSDPAGNPCERAAKADGGDDYAEAVDAVADDLAAVLAGIQERSPDATVVLVGYLRILPPSRGCFPLVPLAAGDIPYLDGIQQRLGRVMARAASDAGIIYVDAYARSLGHDVCQPPDRKWVEGIIPTSPAFPVHPNATGMREVGVMTHEALAANTSLATAG